MLQCIASYSVSIFFSIGFVVVFVYFVNAAIASKQSKGDAERANK